MVVAAAIRVLVDKVVKVVAVEVNPFQEELLVVHLPDLSFMLVVLVLLMVRLVQVVRTLVEVAVVPVQVRMELLILKL